jgi:SAM-dependent methyltransferase
MKRLILVLSLVAGATASAQTITVNQPVRVPEAPGSVRQAPEVPYVPTPEAAVTAMLELAGVKSGDVVYDLGSGDGRIVISAIRDHGASRAVGVDINPDRVNEANENARRARVEDKAEFRQGDLFDADIGEATVVTLYLLPSVNERLKPKLLSELKPGTRIVSHAFDMGDWKPEKEIEAAGTTLYLWVVPERGAGQSSAR